MIITPEEQQYQRARLLIGILSEHGFPSRLVGGCVRDRYLGITPLDYDIATTARPEQVMEIFKQLPVPRVKVIPTGLAHGTVTLVLERRAFEATTLRRDSKADGRHATVSFAASFQEDAARRDFTMNALSEDLDGTIYDYFSGREHLRQKIIVFIGSPAERIQEDYLRILRYYRFKARFGLQGVQGTTSALATLAPGLAQISKERITAEISALVLSATTLAATLSEMAETGIFAQILPELASVLTPSNLLRLGPVFATIQTLAAADRPAAHFASWLFLQKALGLGSANPQQITRHFVLANKQQQFLSWALEGYTELAMIGAPQSRAFAFLDLGDKYCKPPWFLPCFLPLWHSWLALDPAGKEERKARADNLQRLRICEQQKTHVRSHFPLNGKQLAEWTGLPQGPRLGKLLAQLKESYHNEHWQTLGEAQVLAKELIAHETKGGEAD